MKKVLNRAFVAAVITLSLIVTNAQVVEALISPVITGAAQSATSNGFTTGNINCSGANLIVVVLNQVSINPGTIVSSSNATGWVERTATTFGQKTSIWYKENASCSGTETITVGGCTACFPAIWYGMFSGAATTGVFDKEATGAVANSTNTVTVPSAGSITPTNANSLVVSGLGKGSSDSASINGGFSTPDQLGVAGGAAYGVAGSYLIQTTATAVSPTWTWATGDNRQAVMAVFITAAGGGGGSTDTKKNLLLGIGEQ